MQLSILDFGANRVDRIAIRQLGAYKGKTLFSSWKTNNLWLARDSSTGVYCRAPTFLRAILQQRSNS
jgi:hypothetical protein